MVEGLVCRDGELALVSQALRERRKDGIVIVGEAGVGKTRFLDEVCILAGEQGYEVIRAAATSVAGGMSYSALTHLLEMASAKNEGRVGELHPAGSRVRPSAAGRWALVVDDSHLLDERAAALVHHLVRGPRVFTVLSLSDVEPTPQPILALWKDGLVDRLELPRLSRENVAYLLECRLQAAVDGLTAKMLWDASAGNLSVHQELVTSGLETDTLRMTEGVWSWHGPLTPTSRLAESSRARLGEFDDELRQAVELLAIGSPIGAEQIGGLIPQHVLEELEARRVVVTERGNGRILIRFRFPVDAVIVVAGIPELRARRYRIDLAETVDGSYAGSLDDVARVVCWRLDSDLPQSVDTLLRAMSSAWGAQDLALVRRVGDAMLHAGVGDQVIHALIWALLAAEPTANAEAALVDLARGLNGDLSAWVYLACSLNALIRRDDITGTSTYLQMAEATASCPAATAELRSLRALTWSFGGSNRQCLRTTATSLIGSPASNSASRTIGALARGLCLTAMDKMGEAGAALELSRSTERGRTSTSMVEWIAEFAYGTMLTRDGRLTEARTQADVAYRRAVQVDFDFAVALACALQSHVAATCGKAYDGLRYAREGLALGRRSGSNVAVALLLGEVAYSALLLGDSEAAASALRQFDAAVRPHEFHSVLSWTMEIARAWFILSEGDTDGAVQHLMDLANTARYAESWGLEAEALHHVFRMGSSTPTRTRLQELATTGAGGTRLFAAHVTADGDGDALDAIAVSFEGSGYVLFAAEARAQASVAHQATDSVTLRCVSAARSKILADLCPGVRTPYLAVIVKPDLTLREQEITRLAIEGQSNTEIAATLVVSVRTIENHLHRVYGKIGVGRRAELHSLVGPFV